MSDDPFERGLECDFCHMPVDEDEEREPLFIGPNPDPKPMLLQKIVEKQRNMGMMLGVPVDSHLALYQALQSHEDITVNLSDSVYEQDGGFAVGRDSLTYDELDSMAYTRNRDKVAAEVRIEPPKVKRRPDAMVCDYCAEMFRSMRNG